MKKKYGDQDEEERELRMELLGVSGKFVQTIAFNDKHLVKRT